MTSATVPTRAAIACAEGSGPVDCESWLCGRSAAAH